MGSHWGKAGVGALGPCWGSTPPYPAHEIMMMTCPGAEALGKSHKTKQPEEGGPAAASLVMELDYSLGESIMWARHNDDTGS